jgi:hypothetical protein
MINQGNNVPDKTIAVFIDHMSSLKYEDLHTILDQLDTKRNWFDSNFYRCLPLTIANKYGFVIKSQFSFSFNWNGDNNIEGIEIYTDETEGNVDNKYPRVESHFGSGIITVALPLTFRTPPGVNLMTINPPNIILPNITVMSGVVEADNLRRDFTFNLKVQIPNIQVHIPAGTPLAAIIPVPRYYCDGFKLKNADDLFSQELILEESQAKSDTITKRTELEILNKYKIGRDYLQGKDVYDNYFKDHQKP